MSQKLSEPVLIEVEDKTVTVFLTGDLDHSNAKEIRDDIDFAIDRNLPERLVLDFSELDFMDSSGIGLIMGRFRKCEPIGCKITVSGAKGTIKKVIKIAGIERLATLA
ncbi:MAG: STAS domain-containing protein [Ruminococcus sp.]|jgi:stage II sporulation protein AA (anti-sigma F factor antagonist)|nr:STAS domain-containing protein [Ruminococcus sp.]